MTGFLCSRSTLIVLNTIYVLLGVFLIGFGAYGRVATQMVSVNVISGVIVCGVILLIVSLMGMIGTVKHNQVLLFFYMVLLFLLFLIQFSVCCACLALNDVNQKVILTNAWRSLNYGERIMVMRQFQCCGLRQPDESVNTSLGHPPCNLVPLPCCQGNDAPCCVGISSNASADLKCPCTQACWPILHDRLNSSLKITGAFGLVFSFIEIVGVWLAMQYRNQRNPNADPSAFL
jgi:tetraspanin-13/31